MIARTSLHAILWLGHTKRVCWEAGGEKEKKRGGIRSSEGN